MSELIPRQWAEGEEAGWIADKVCILGDYGQDAARVLLRQVEELTELRSQVAELQRQLDEAAKQESFNWLELVGRTYDCKATMTRYSIGGYFAETAAYLETAKNNWTVKPHFGIYPDLPKLYTLPPSIPAIIEQAKAEEREECAKSVEAVENATAGSKWHCAAAIRARKP